MADENTPNSFSDAENTAARMRPKKALSPRSMIIPSLLFGGVLIMLGRVMLIDVPAANVGWAVLYAVPLFIAGLLVIATPILMMSKPKE